MNIEIIESQRAAELQSLTIDELRWKLAVIGYKFILDKHIDNCIVHENTIPQHILKFDNQQEVKDFLIAALIKFEP